MFATFLSYSRKTVRVWSYGSWIYN